MKRNGIIFLMCINVVFALAQGTVEGYVRDETGETIVGANVVLIQNDEIIVGTTTDIDGHYTIDNVQEGEYFFQISQVGNKTAPEIIRIRDRETLALSYELSTVIELEGGTVWGKKPIESIFNPDKPDVEGFIYTTITENKPRSIEAIAKTTGKTTVDKDGNVSYKGSRPGSGVYYIDGMRVVGELDIPMVSIYSLEIYSGGIPARYGNTLSAVIDIRTKSYFDFFD